jgi:predicted nucleotidyltransferase
MQSGQEILAVLQSHKDVLQQRFSAHRIGLFGSCVRGGARPDRDVDILVELGEPTFDHYMDLKFYLEDVLGAPVDLVMADCVKPRLQPIIAQEVVYA